MKEFDTLIFLRINDLANGFMCSIVFLIADITIKFLRSCDYNREVSSVDNIGLNWRFESEQYCTLLCLILCIKYGHTKTE